ncbi:hypothetical protein D3C79_865380 [compost metagenome]
MAGSAGAPGKIAALRCGGVVRCGVAGHFSAHRVPRSACHATGGAAVGAVWLAVPPDVGGSSGFLQPQRVGQFELCTAAGDFRIGVSLLFQSPDTGKRHAQPKNNPALFAKPAGAP